MKHKYFVPGVPSIFNLLTKTSIVERGRSGFASLISHTLTVPCSRSTIKTMKKMMIETTIKTMKKMMIETTIKTMKKMMIETTMKTMKKMMIETTIKTMRKMMIETTIKTMRKMMIETTIKPRRKGLNAAIYKINWSIKIIATTPRERF